MSPDTAISLINRMLPEPHASLLAGMLFGVNANMPGDFYDALIDTGTVHVIALSGMNISIIVRVLFDSLHVLLGRVVSVIITICGIAGFVLFVGPSATIVRAAIMGSMSLLAVLFGRRDIPLLSLVLAATTMIVVQPSILTSVSFQLSCSATLGILLFAGNTGEYSQEGLVHRGKTFLLTELRMTLAAQVFTAPLIMYYFNQISLISPIANVIIAWLVGPITILGLIIVVIGVLFYPIGYAMSFLVYPFLSIFIYTISLLAKVPIASVSW